MHGLMRLVSEGGHRKSPVSKPQPAGMKKDQEWHDTNDDVCRKLLLLSPPAKFLNDFAVLQHS